MGQGLNDTYQQPVDNYAHYFTSRSRHAHVIHMLDKGYMLSSQSLSKAHREPHRGIARGVLLAFGIALCLIPYTSSSTTMQHKEYITPKQYALYLLDFNVKEYKCLTTLYGKESAWNPDARNGSHYGIPQGKSLWLKDQDAYTQVQWGLNYIGNRYGEPCVAWQHWIDKGWH